MQKEIQESWDGSNQMGRMMLDESSRVGLSWINLVDSQINSTTNYQNI